jgi:chromosome segregation ATPase
VTSCFINKRRPPRSADVFEHFGQEERALSLAKQDLDSKATAVQQNCNRMDAELSRAEEERRIIEQQLLIVQGDVELVKARVEAMKRQIQNDTGTVIEMESSTVRTSARVGECKVKIEAALKKLGTMDTIARFRVVSIRGFLSPSR